MPTESFNMLLTRVALRLNKDSTGPDKTSSMLSPSRKIAGGIRKLFHKLWSKRHAPKWKLKKSPSKEEGDAVEKVEWDELFSSPPGSFSDLLKLSLPDTSSPRLSLLQECRKSLSYSISVDLSSEPSEPEDETDVVSEREKALHILEQPREESAIGSSDPEDFAWIRKRSYQLATEPWVESQRFADFQRQLEDKLAANLALCFDVWENITSQLISEVCEPVDTKYPTNPLTPEPVPSRESFQKVDGSRDSLLQNKTISSPSSEVDVRTNSKVKGEKHPTEWHGMRSNHGNPAIEDPEPPVEYEVKSQGVKCLPRPQSSRFASEINLPLPSAKKHRRKRRATAPCLIQFSIKNIKPKTPSGYHMECDSTEVKTDVEPFGYELTLCPGR
ncbi:hypothetical protein F4811DRAFT_556495 [Daldinia bambusicola]|nr:hypothetical protein F4811DRAFT_556495 [Daldinia bambusicola]